MNERVSTTFRINKDELRLLRKLSYLKEMSLNKLICESIHDMIEKEKKVLINASVVLS